MYQVTWFLGVRLFWTFSNILLSHHVTTAKKIISKRNHNSVALFPIFGSLYCYQKFTYIIVNTPSRDRRLFQYQMKEMLFNVVKKRIYIYMAPYLKSQAVALQGQQNPDAKHRQLCLSQFLVLFFFNFALCLDRFSLVVTKMASCQLSAFWKNSSSFPILIHHSKKDALRNVLRSLVHP